MTFKRFAILLCFCVSIISGGFSQEAGEERLIFFDDFITFDSLLWTSDGTPIPSPAAYVRDGFLIIDTSGNVTIWLNRKFSGDIKIEFTRKTWVDTFANDHRSGLSIFWQATDPRRKNFFSRNSAPRRADQLRLYYLSMSNQSHSTTRFGKYLGNGQQVLLKQYTDSTHTQQTNKEDVITIEMRGKRIRHSINGEVYLEYTDAAVLKEGYLGFRVTGTKQAIDKVKVYRFK